MPELTSKAQPEVQATVKTPQNELERFEARKALEPKPKDETKAEPVAEPEAEVPAIEGEETEPTEDSSQTDQFVQTVKVGEKEVPVEEVFKDAKFTIPVGDEDFEFTGIDEVMKFAGMGIHAAQKNEKAKQVIAEANQAITEMEARVKTVETSISKAVNEGVVKTLDELFASVQKGMNPNTGQPLNKTDQGVMENAIRTAKGLHENHAPKADAKSPEDIQKLIDDAVDKRLQASQSEARNNQIMATAQDIFTKAVEPYAQKFLRSDGKTVNQRVYDSFKENVSVEAARLVQGKKISAEQGKRVMEQAVKNVLPDYSEFFTKPTKTETTKTTAPVVRQSGGTQAGNRSGQPQQNGTKRIFKNFSDYLDNKFANLQKK